MKPTTNPCHHVYLGFDRVQYFDDLWWGGGGGGFRFSAHGLKAAVAIDNNRSTSAARAVYSAELAIVAINNRIIQHDWFAVLKAPMQL